MHVLLIGKGGREHALAWKLSRSPLLTHLSLWPHSAALEPLGTALDLSPAADVATVVARAKELGVDLVVCGPEAPLAAGLADHCRAAGLAVFGPGQAAARLETSKAFAKAIMARAKIPTASHQVVTSEAQCRAVAAQQLKHSGGVVLKASGLAAGKGVFVCRDDDAVAVALRHLYHSDMAAAAAEVVVEELLEGRECSYFITVGQLGSRRLGFAVDYKRLLDGDHGPNTGGMGSYAPVPWLPSDAGDTVDAQVVRPLLAALAASGIPYTGWLYVGLMWSKQHGPRVVEFNVRLGDPEAEVLAMLDDRDWLPVIAAQAGLAVPPAALAAAAEPTEPKGVATVVVMASANYPFGEPRPDSGTIARERLAGPRTMGEPAGATVVFGAAIAPGEQTSTLRPGHGRVLVVGARGATFDAARSSVYQTVAELAAAWPGAQWRRDIAAGVPRKLE